MPASFGLGRLVFATFLLAVFSSGPSAAATGTAMGVKIDASIESGAITRTLVVGDDLLIGDRVVTDKSGLVQILFEDSTELVVGPNSELVIEDYLLRQDGSAGRLAINALSGTFRFVTGLAPKDRYEITTPTGTMGVRGTAF
ncbi:MAG: FecR domain-containing protein, partial [Devosia sp.]